MNLKNIMLNKGNQIEKIRYCKILFIKQNIERQEADQWLPGAENKD